jgi:hypothetical protein
MTAAQHVARSQDVLAGAAGCRCTHAEIGDTVTVMVPRSIAILAIVIVPTTAFAAPEPSTASLLEPGSLARGQLGLRINVGLGSGPTGIGVEGVLGLGGIDVLASTSVVPPLCIVVGEDKSCSSPDLFAGLGAQARLGRAGPLAFGVRVRGETLVAGGTLSIANGGLVMSTGGDHWRVSLTPTVLGWYEVRPAPAMADENGWYLGGAVGISYSRGNSGFEVVGGVAAPLSGQAEALPLASISFFTRS